MAKFVTMNAEGLATGFYDEAFHGARLLEGGGPNPDTKIPVGAVAIPDELYATWAVNTLALRYSGGALVPYSRPSTIPSMATIRQRRNALLAASDWTQLPDVPLSTGIRAAWATYRQALRDLPAALVEPLSAAPTWPAPPT